jgi:hypothetical protein
MTSSTDSLQISWKIVKTKKTRNVTGCEIPLGYEYLHLPDETRGPGREGAVLVTNNESGFNRYPGVAIENWIFPP